MFSLNTLQAQTIAKIKTFILRNSYIKDLSVLWLINDVFPLIFTQFWNVYLNLHERQLNILKIHFTLHFAQLLITHVFYAPSWPPLFASYMKY